MRILLFAALIALVPRAAAAYEIEVRGNLALPAAVYESAVVLSDAARTTTASVADARREEVRRSVLDFLLASGYDLATVTSTIVADKLYVDVDEGRLDKILFLRQGTLRTLELKFSVQLPGDVFNRPLLEQQLRRIVQETDVTHATFSVVEVERVDHSGMQLDNPKLLRRLDLVDADAPHELHITLDSPDRTDGVKVGIGIRSPDGFYGRLAFEQSDLVLPGDRIDLETSIGFHITGNISTTSNPVGLSRLRGALELHSPPFGEYVSTYLRLDANLYGRFRRDLGVANYYYLPLESSLNVAMQATKILRVGLGLGFVERLLFGVDPAEARTIAPLVATTDRADPRMFLELRIDLDFDESELRLDRHHHLSLEGRFLAAGSSVRSDVITKLKLEYDKVLQLGYDEFHLGVNGAHIFGAPFFYDELSIGDGFLRAAFGNDIFLKRALGMSFEYRVSLTREVFKVSVFDDFVTYQHLDGDREPGALRAATTVGVGLHVLLLDAFQLNGYAGIGLAPGQTLGFGIALNILRAY